MCGFLLHLSCYIVYKVMSNDLILKSITLHFITKVN